MERTSEVSLSCELRMNKKHFNQMQCGHFRIPIQINLSHTHAFYKENWGTWTINRLEGASESSVHCPVSLAITVSRIHLKEITRKCREMKWLFKREGQVEGNRGIRNSKARLTSEGSWLWLCRNIHTYF